MSRVDESAVLEIASCASTNGEAMRLGVGGECGPLWVLARHQEMGRGRAGRKWVSVSGNLYTSLLIRFPEELSNFGQLSLVAGLGVFDAVHGLAEHSGTSRLSQDMWLKWPNDIMIGSAKCGGILVESSVTAGRSERLVVVGIGLNLALAPDVEDRTTTCLKAHGLDVTPRALLSEIDQYLLAGIEAWACGRGSFEVNLAFLARTRGVGKPISVHAGENVLRGTFAGLAPNGHLLIKRATGGVQEVSWGDVSFE